MFHKPNYQCDRYNSPGDDAPFSLDCPAPIVMVDAGTTPLLGRLRLRFVTVLKRSNEARNWQKRKTWEIKWFEIVKSPPTKAASTVHM